VDLVCWFDAGELRVESLDDIPPEDLLCPECADLLSESDYVEDTPTEALSGRQQSAHPTAGRECQFFNVNAADDQYRQETVEKLRERLTAEPVGTLRVLMHSIAWGSLKPLAGAEQVVSKKQLEMTADTMGHSLVYWVQDCLKAGLFDWGGRIFAMTSAGGSRAIPNYGPVSAAKAILEAHTRQLAVELAPAGITANAILAGVTDTPALRLIPGHEDLVKIARQRNPHKRLTVPEDVARCITALCHPATYWMTGNTLHVDGGENVVG
jgi:enoyl-[acyl-carrier protein] reductase III